MSELTCHDTGREYTTLGQLYKQFTFDGVAVDTKSIINNACDVVLQLAPRLLYVDDVVIVASGQYGNHDYIKIQWVRNQASILVFYAIEYTSVRVTHFRYHEVWINHLSYIAELIRIAGLDKYDVIGDGKS